MVKFKDFENYHEKIKQNIEECQKILCSIDDYINKNHIYVPIYVTIYDKIRSLTVWQSDLNLMFDSLVSVLYDKDYMIVSNDNKKIYKFHCNKNQLKDTVSIQHHETEKFNECKIYVMNKDELTLVGHIEDSNFIFYAED